jgi:hypothetical protein
MRSLSAGDLLNLWETCIRQPLAEVALRLLSAAYPDTSYEDLAQLSVGQRDALLLALREQLFGAQFVSIAKCPQCGERLQLTFTASDLHTTMMTGTDPLSLEAGPYAIRYRLPNSADLLVLTSCDSVETGRRLLLTRCLLSMQRDGVDQPIDAVPPEVSEAIALHMAQADPQANVQFDLNCPTCGHRWQAAFDVMMFLWNEIDRWARRLLFEIHRLARAYGWSEAEILSLSTTRRQAYLNLIGNR